MAAVSYQVYQVLYQVFDQLVKSGFRPGDSCTNHLLSITRESYNSFNDGFEIRSVFRIYLKPLIKFGIKGFFLHQESYSMANITARVSQGSIISPLSFLKYTNDIIDNITCC